MENASDRKIENKRNPQTSGSATISSTVLLDFSFKSILNTKDIIDEVKTSEIPGIKRNSDSGKLLCTALRLNNNSISDLEDFSESAEELFHDPEAIEWIDFSFNDMNSIDRILLKFKNLKVLYLHGNTIEKIQEVDKLRGLPQLKSLTLHGNPVESEKGYRQYVISLLPGLKTLDFSGVTKQDRATAQTWNKMYGGTKRKRKKSTT